jgi:hypothetical protein
MRGESFDPLAGFGHAALDHFVALSQTCSDSGLSWDFPRIFRGIFNHLPEIFHSLGQFRPTCSDFQGFDVMLHAQSPPASEASSPPHP